MPGADGEFNRALAADPTAGPLLVVVAPPGLKHGAGVGQRPEEGLVEELIPEPKVA